MTTQNFLLILASILITFSVTAQLQHPEDRFQISPQNPDEVTMRSRYKLEFELTDESQLGDSTLLEGINPLTIEYFRNDNEDVIFPYRSPSVEILIYSRKRISKKSNELLETE